MRGEREYEFVAVGVFVAEGDARFLARTLTAYGYHRDQFGPGLQRLPKPAQPTLDALADCWFAAQ